MTNACPGCGEIPEQIEPSDPGLGLVTFHRGGCAAYPEPSRCTCLYADGDVVEFALEACAHCQQLARVRAEVTPTEGIAR